MWDDSPKAMRFFSSGAGSFQQAVRVMICWLSKSGMSPEMGGINLPKMVDLCRFKNWVSHINSNSLWWALPVSSLNARSSHVPPRSLEFVREAMWLCKHWLRTSYMVFFKHAKTKMGKKASKYLSTSLNMYHCCHWGHGWARWSLQAQWASQALWLDPSVDARIPMTLGPRTKPSRPHPGAGSISGHPELDGHDIFWKETIDIDIYIYIEI